MSHHYVYYHCKPDGVPFYVGKGSGKRASTIYSKNRNAWYRSVVAKYGADSIAVRVVYCASEQDAYALEISEIARLRAEGCDLVNFHFGGRGGTTPCAETRAKMSAAAQRRPPRSDDVRARISASLKGKPKSLEHVTRVAVALAGRKVSETEKGRLLSIAIGRKQSEEEKRKRADACRGKKRSDEFRAKMSAIAKARPNPGLSRTGSITDEHKAKVSAGLKRYHAEKRNGFAIANGSGCPNNT